MLARLYVLKLQKRTPSPKTVTKSDLEGYGIIREESEMLVENVLEAAFDKVKRVFSQNERLLDQELTPDSAEQISGLLTQAMSAGWVAAFRAWLTAHECQDETVDVDGQLYRYKLDSDKEFLTFGGLMTVSRRVYQPDAGGPCHVPLDAAWGMQGEFATPKVREAVLYGMALITPGEVETLLKKCALFQPGQTAIRRMAERMGCWLEEHEDSALGAIREAEPVPAGTRVLAASLDGVNVLLSERGKKKGRPAERPGEHGDRQDSPTSYRNAMVGSVSLYGEVPAGKKCPERLVSRYAARMPEEKAPTLKRKFEAELAALDSQLEQNVVRIVLCDAARGLWSYIDETSQFEGWEKAVDFHHATDHLSRAAESLFGKGSARGTCWYQKYRKALKCHEDGADRVIRSMDYYARTRRLSKHRQEQLAAERTFFVNNKRRMPYARFLENGWPIGSGPVEAACKSVVKTRLCRSGMRWSRERGQHVLSLRTFVKSNRWEALWQHYKATLCSA